MQAQDLVGERESESETARLTRVQFAAAGEPFGDPVQVLLVDAGAVVADDERNVRGRDLRGDPDGGAGRRVPLRVGEEVVHHALEQRSVADDHGVVDVDVDAVVGHDRGQPSRASLDQLAHVDVAVLDLDQAAVEASSIQQ